MRGGVPLAPLALRAGLARRPVPTVVLVAGLLVVGFVVLRLAFAVPLAGFVVAGREFVDPAQTPDPVPVVAGTAGYDGQFVYRLAVDPWTAAVVEHGVELDNPAYRHQRIATPALAWIVALAPGVSTLLALVLVNAAALVVAAWYATRLATAAGRHPLCGLLLAFPASMPISLGRDLTEPVAWAGVLAGLWYARSRRWPAAALALTAAALARESSLVVVLGLAAGEVLRRGRSRSPSAAAPGLRWLAVPIVVGGVWQVMLWRLWGTLPLRSGGSGNLGDLPVLGVLRSIVADLPDFTSATVANPLVGVVVFGERVAVLALFCYAGLALVRRYVRVNPGEAAAWALAVALAVSLRRWSTDVQFLRAANEAVGLSVLVALHDDRPVARPVRALVAALVAGVALMYVVRQ